MSTFKFKSREASEENLKKFFENNTSDTVKIEQIYTSWGRDLEDVDRNKAWLSNLLTHLKHHNLVKPVYNTNGGKRVLSGVKLTQVGRRVLGMDEYEKPEKSSLDDEQNNKEINITAIVAQYIKDHPEYKVTFNLELRNQEDWSSRLE